MAAAKVTVEICRPVIFQAVSCFLEPYEAPSRADHVARADNEWRR